jgi:hypothetical protein
MNGNNYVALIQLYGKMQPSNAEPLSVEALAGALAEDLPSVDVKIFTFSYLDEDKKLDLLINELDACQPFLVGISIPQSTYELSLKLLDRLIKLSPSPLIVIGHALPSYSPEVFLRIYRQLVVVRGWGEDSIVNLAKQALENKPYEFAEIPNLVFYREGDIRYTELKLQTKLYRPARFELGNYFIRMEASRGCSYNVCTFCTRPIGMQNSSSPWIRRNSEEIISELYLLITKGVSRFTFTDEDFVGTDLDAALELAYRLQEIDGLRFSLSVRADSIYDPQKAFAENQETKKLFAVLRDAGLELAFVGAESFSKSQLRRYGKGIDPETNLMALSVLQSLGINYEIGFILFDPLMSVAEVGENILSLDKSGIWSRVGNLFNVLRPQIGSPYVKMLVSSELLGDFNINTLSYEYKFIDPKIELLAKFFNELEIEIDLIYLLCRNLERTTESHIVYAKSMFDFRSLFFRVLKASFELLEEETRFITPQLSFREYYREQDGIINALAYQLQKNKFMNKTEEDLLLHCQNYISSNSRSWE